MLTPVNVLWVLHMEHIDMRGPYPSEMSLFFNVVFLLFFVALGNIALGRLRPRWALNQGELIIVYIMLATSTALSGLDGMQTLLPVITHGFWFATPENRYDQLLTDAPRWLVVADKGILSGYYNGSSTLYQWPIIRAWLTPILWWLGFIVVLVFAMISLSVIVRAQWADRERLTFPIIQLPLAVTEPASQLWRNSLLWVGLAVAGSVDLLNGLHYLYPSIPYLQVAPTSGNPGANDIARFFPDLPWSAIGWLPVTFYPAVIGIAFLVPLDILFSCVFFFFWWKLMFVIAAMLGVSEGWRSLNAESVFPYALNQMFGGYMAIAIGPLLIGRSYFKAMWRRIIGRPSEVSGAGEGMSYRLAAFGLVMGFGLLIWFSVHGGLSLRLAILYFAIYGLLCLAVARVRAEFGSPVHDLYGAGPGQTITYVAGTAGIRQQDLVMLGILWWFNRTYIDHPIGTTIEGVQMAHRSRSSSRALVWAIVLATVFSAIAFFWGWLHSAYATGVSSGWAGGDWRGDEMIQGLQGWIQNPTQPNLGALLGISAGYAITMLLVLARTTFIAWPFHPVAYALSANWFTHLVWLPMLIAWTVKSLTLRYGGLQAYRKALPLFYGLILGESVIGCGWSIVGLLTGRQTYSFWGL